MLLPLGLLAASSPAPAGSYELLESVVLSSSQTAVTFSNLATYASSYRHLQIRCTMRNTANAGTGGLNARFNSDSGTNYSYHILQGNGSSISAANATSQSFAVMGWVPHGSVTPGGFSSTVVDLLEPFSTKTKTWRSLSGSLVFSNIMGLWGGAWYSSNSLSSISFIAESGNSFAAGSRISIYGLKA